MISSLALWLVLVGIGVALFVLLADEHEARRTRKERKR